MQATLPANKASAVAILNRREGQVQSGAPGSGEVGNEMTNESLPRPAPQSHTCGNERGLWSDPEGLLDSATHYRGRVLYFGVGPLHKVLGEAEGKAPVWIREANRTTQTGVSEGVGARADGTDANTAADVAQSAPHR